MKRIGIREIIVAGLLSIASLGTPAMAGKQIVIVKSSDNAYFSESVETLVSRVEQAEGFRILAADELAGAIDPADDDQLLVALGQVAIEAIQRFGSRAPVVNAYITLEQFRELGIDGQPSILLDQPLRRYLAFTALTLDPGSVGIVVEREITLDPGSTVLLDDLGLELTQYRIDEQDKLLPVLRRLLQREDSLLMLPRARIYNRDSLKGVLLTSYRNRKPAISYSPAHVKSGALASIYSSPRDIGHHLALLINRMLAEPGYRPPDYEFARFYSISTNPRVARALGLTLPGEAELRDRLDGMEP